MHTSFTVHFVFRYFRLVNIVIVFVEGLALADFYMIIIMQVMLITIASIKKSPNF